MNIAVGARVRSHDFGKDYVGDRAAFVEGIVTGFRWLEGCVRYTILVDRDVFRGEEKNGEYSRVGGEVFPPVNGTPIAGGDRITDMVETL